MLRRKGWFATALVALMIAGCGGDEFSVKTVTVSGKVTIGGQPAKGVNVHFLHEKATGFGKTDDSGNFKLIQGAVPGENRVYFTMASGDTKFDNPEGGMDAGQLQAMAQAAPPGSAAAKKLGIVIPPEFSDPGKTQLKFVVPGSGSDSANFELPKF
jgi:hypothetical protein